MPRRYKRFNLPASLRIGNLIFIAVLVILTLTFFNLLRSFILTSPYFRISRVEIALIGRISLADNTVKRLLNIHRGRNILEADLKTTRDYIVANFPEVRTIVVNRVFPDKLILKIRPRRAVAQVSMPSGFCWIDAEAVVFPDIRGLAEPGLPIISGLDPRSILASSGKKSTYQSLRKALWLLEIMNQMQFSKEHEIHMIDASDEKNLSVYIEGGIEIRIGGEDFRSRISVLNKTFNTGRLDKNQIKYIDLRFGNVIIGPR